MQYITSRDGVKIGFLREGAGPPLIFVHGAAADHRSWIDIMQPLGQRFTVYAMDRRGRGFSGDAPEYDLSREAGDVAALAESTGAPAAVVGHSFGGLVALEAALQCDQIQRLILYEPYIPGSERSAPQEVIDRIQVQIDRGELEEAMVTFLRGAALLTEEEVAAYRQGPLWKSRIPLIKTVLREIAVEDGYQFSPARLAALDRPVLLLLGGDSQPVYRRSIETLHAALPDSRIAVLPGQRHLAYRTAPEMFIKALLDFLTA